MSGTTGIAILCGLVLILVALRAAQSIRHDREKHGDGRGSAPGKGYHVIDSSYHSGGAGGGHSSEFRVPKDPQTYARLFVPHERKRKDENHERRSDED